MSANNTRFTQGVPRLHLIVSTGLGTGFCPVAPGTAGALLALLLWYGLYLALPPFWLTLATVLLCVVTLFVGVWTSDVMERYWGPDPRAVNIDEFLGTWIPLIVCATDDARLTALYALIAFALFRIIDIFKPLGCRWIDTRVRGGWGVMLDDALAGGYSLLIILLLRCVAPFSFA